MKRVLALLITIMFGVFASSPILAQGQSHAPQAKFRRSEKAILNQYVVVLKDSVAPADVAAVATQLSRTHGGKIKNVYEHALKGFALRLPEAAALALSQDPRVEYVQEDAEASIVTTQYSPPTGLDRIDQRYLPLDNSYTYNSTGAGVNVYVIDTGIRPTHQEFGGRASIAADYVGDGQNGNDCTGMERTLPEPLAEALTVLPKAQESMLCACSIAAVVVRIQPSSAALIG